MSRLSTPTGRRHLLRRAWLVPAVLGLAATLTLSSPAGAEPSDTGLKQTLDRILADPRLDGGIASVVVREAAGGKTVYEHQADNRLMPASNTKLPTSAAAMEILGPDFRFDTEVLSRGPRRGHTLRGDLYLRGTGDPTMLAADYDELAAEVAAAGITRVTGNLVADDTRFDKVRLGRSWAGDDESAYYSAQISALTVSPDTDYDSGTVHVKAVPGERPGARPRLTVTPKTDYVKIDNRGSTVAAGGRDTLHIEREHGSNTITISGQVPVGGDATEEWVSVWEPTGYAAAIFRDALRAHGVHVSGPTRTDRPTPAGAARVANRRSMELKNLLIPFMKLSNNGHAEILTKTIGHQVSGSGSWDAGLAAIGAYLKKEDVRTDTLSQVDGSGLSRMNNIPARQLGNLLTSVQDAPWFADWYTSLPVACGADRMTGGTLRTRMCGTPAAGNAHAKTGSLTGASGLSGYVTDRDGRKLVFSIVTNNYLVASVKPIEDAVVVAMASYKASAPAARTTRIAPAKAGDRTELECSWLKPARC